MNARKIARITIVTVAVLMIPLAAMQFSDDVLWTLSDFVLAGVLLLAAGLAYEVAASKTQQLRYKVAIAIGLAAVLIVIWLHLAVGLLPGVPGGT